MRRHFGQFLLERYAAENQHSSWTDHTRSPGQGKAKEEETADCRFLVLERYRLRLSPRGSDPKKCVHSSYTRKHILRWRFIPMRTDKLKFNFLLGEPGSDPFIKLLQGRNGTLTVETWPFIKSSLILSFQSIRRDHPSHATSSQTHCKCYRGSVRHRGIWLD